MGRQLNMRPLRWKKKVGSIGKTSRRLSKNFKLPIDGKASAIKLKPCVRLCGGGSEETKKFLRGYQIGKLPEIEGRSGMKMMAGMSLTFADISTPIEMLDLYFPLKEKEGQANDL